MEKQAAEQMVVDNEKFLVYFLGYPSGPFSDDIEYVKIGRSSSKWIAERRQKLQVGSPLKLVCLGVLPYRTFDKCRVNEKRFHEYFADYRIYEDRHEWFYACDELMEFINVVSEPLSDYELPLADNYKNKAEDIDDS